MAKGTFKAWSFRAWNFLSGLWAGVGAAPPPSTASPWLIAAAQCAYRPVAAQVGHGRAGAVAGQCQSRPAVAGEVEGR